jgi:RNA-directed DNA polymerase
MIQKRKVRQDGWYIKKSFPHFDLPLNFEDAKTIVTDPIYVSRKSFWPFIGFVDQKRKFKRVDGEVIVKLKERPLRYCSHHDGYIHSYYAAQLAAKYEARIKAEKIDSAVIGYRQNVGTNVHMAKAAFDEISRRGNCVVIALDIESFFDSIDHRILKANLQSVLGVPRLTTDWFKILRSMTEYSWVEIDSIAERLDFDVREPPRPLCSAIEFRKVVRGGDGILPTIVRTNTNNFGIPQGSPISATFSNVYMLSFDQACVKHFDEIDVFYRRYSDDIIVVCNSSQHAAVIDFISNEILKLGPSMKISAEKTEVSTFSCALDGQLSCDRPVTYLGLTFDGERTRLRGRTISRYYRRMTYAARHAAKAAARVKSKKVFKRKLYSDLSHLGKHNFYSYAKNAAATLKDNAPVRQLRRHVKILQRKVAMLGR